MDGHSAGAGRGELIDRLGEDSELREKWQAYCLIGDALRGEPALGRSVAARVMSVLENEPTVLAPVRVRHKPSHRGALLDRALPIAASLMGVAAVGWVAMTLSETRISESSAVAPVAALKQLPASIERVSADPAPIDLHREYVFIHQASSRNGPIPSVAQYVRSVSELQSGGNR